MTNSGSSRDRHEASEHLKNLMMGEKPSPWPKIMVGLFILLILGGAGYWFYLPADKRPPIDALMSHIMEDLKRMANSPIMSSAPAAAPASTPTSAQKSAPTSAPASDTGLLSN
jgi:hypothetical protein